MEEISLIKRCIRGDKRAWDCFLGSYSNIIYSAISRTLTRNGFVGSTYYLKDDIFNSVILKLIEDDFRRLKKYRGGKENYSLKNWLRVVTTNMVVDFLRKEGKTFSLSGHDEQDISFKMESSHNPEKVATDRETLSKVAEVIKELRPNECLIIELLFIKGLPRDRVADIMQTSQGNINTIVHRIRNKIRTMLPDV